MVRKPIFLLLLVLWTGFANAQTKKSPQDSLLNLETDYDELFSELELFLDSLLAPKTYAVLNIGGGSSFYDYNISNSNLKSKRSFVLTPSAGYYHKSGFGASGTVAIVNETGKLNAYQFLGALSYDYLKNLDFVAGISASHFFTKDSLNFYTSPLKNELYSYFIYRKSWFKPSVSASYGWGSRSSVVEREDYITSLRKRKKKGNNIIDTSIITTEESLTEKISDFNLAFSVRHDFYWLNVFSDRDFIRLSPQISFVSGTQRFGFNQTINTYSSLLNSKKNESFLSENSNLDERVNFQPLFISAFLKSELTIGKYFLQPQFGISYYLPAPDKNISTAFSLNTGFIF